MRCSYFDAVRTDIKFMLLHESRNEDGIMNFFNEVYELYTKVRASLALQAAY